MNTTAYRRIVAIAGAAAITTITTIAGSPATSASTAAGDQDRPCFAVRAHWNTAEGPQPTCPVPTWQRADKASVVTGGSLPDRMRNVSMLADYLP